MDLNASICSHSWSYFFMISFHTSLANVYLHMRFSTTMWSNFTMQHEPGWITIEFHDCRANSRNLYPFLFSPSSIFYAFKQPWKEWPTSVPHLLECTSTIIRSTSETNANDLKQRHSSVFTYNDFSCWSWGLGNEMIHWNKMVIHQTKNLNKAISILHRLRVTSEFTMPMARTYSCPNLGIC